MVQPQISGSLLRLRRRGICFIVVSQQAFCCPFSSEEQGLSRLRVGRLCFWLPVDMK